MCDLGQHLTATLLEGCGERVGQPLTIGVVDVDGCRGVELVTVDDLASCEVRRDHALQGVRGASAEQQVLALVLGEYGHQRRCRTVADLQHP